MRRLCLLLALVLSGCDVLRPPGTVDPEGESLQVHSVLWEGSDTVLVLVERSWMENGYARVGPVSGARVRIAGGGAEAVLPEAPAGFRACLETNDHYAGSQPAPPAIGPGCYAAVLSGGVRAGESYSLLIELADGRSVTGRTTVPHPLELVRPAEGARIAVPRVHGGRGAVHDSLLLEWRSGNGEGRSWPGLVPVAVHAGGRLVPGARCQAHLSRADAGSPFSTPLRSQGDSVRVRASIGPCHAPSAPGTAPSELRPDSVAAVLSMSAFDSAYHEYYRRSSTGVREENASAGLEGAYGLFGSAAAAQRRLMLVFTGS